MSGDVRKIQYFLMVIFTLLHNTSLLPTEFINQKGAITEEVPLGDTIVLRCGSNDQDHIFEYWLVEGRNMVIGPTNKDYDSEKFKYEVMSGNLTIRKVSKQEEGLYCCVSKGVNSEDINVRRVRMMVVQDWEAIYEHDSTINTIRILIIIITLVIVAGGAYVLYTMWKERYREPGYLEQTAGEEEDDESVDEIFRSPGPSGMSRSTDRIVNETNLKRELEEQNFSTDFNSILDTVNNK